MLPRLSPNLLVQVAYSPAHGPLPVGIYLNHHLLTYEQATEFARRLGWHLFDFADTIAPACDQIVRGVAWSGTLAKLKTELKR